jgi:hypothetical protein
MNHHSHHSLPLGYSQEACRHQTRQARQVRHREQQDVAAEREGQDNYSIADRSQNHCKVDCNVRNNRVHAGDRVWRCPSSKGQELHGESWMQWSRKKWQVLNNKKRDERAEDGVEYWLTGYYKKPDDFRPTVSFPVSYANCISNVRVYRIYSTIHLQLLTSLGDKISEYTGPHHPVYQKICFRRT